MKPAEVGSLLANYFKLGMADSQIERTHLSTSILSVSFMKHHCSALPVELYRRSEYELWPW